MPFALLIIGTVLVVSAVKGTQGQLAQLVKSDFTGSNNFIYWTVSILLIGSVGYIPKLKSLSTAFLALVIIVLVLTKGNPQAVGGGFFQQFTQGIASTQSATTNQTSPLGTTSTTPGTTGGISPFQIPSIIGNTLGGML